MKRMKKLNVRTRFAVLCLFISFAGSSSFCQAAATISNPNWYINLWDSGYSDWMISPHGHEQLSGDRV